MTTNLAGYAVLTFVALVVAPLVLVLWRLRVARRRAEFAENARLDHERWCRERGIPASVPWGNSGTSVPLADFEAVRELSKEYGEPIEEWARRVNAERRDGR